MALPVLEVQAGAWLEVQAGLKRLHDVRLQDP